MKSKIFTILFIYSYLFIASSYAQEMITDNATKQQFPRDIAFEAQGKTYQLQATGVATRRKLVIKVYSIAHYLQREAMNSRKDRFQIILSDEYAKQFTMKWVHDVDVNKVQQAFYESFHRVFPGQQYSEMQGVIQNFIQYFNRDAKRGEEYILRWIPGGVVEVIIDGNKVGSVTSVEFARGLWTVWFGDNSIVNRNDLVSFMR